MAKVKVTIEGISPLLIGKFNREIPTDTDPRVQAASHLYTSEDGAHLILPSICLTACVIEAGVFFKVGRTKLTTRKTSMIPACLTLEGIQNPTELILEHEAPWRVDTRPVFRFGYKYG